MIEPDNNFTPAPWWICDEGFVCAGNGSNSLTIASPRCSNDLDPQEVNANSQLMAHAPDLAKRLWEMINLVETKLGKEEAVQQVEYLKAAGLVQALEQHGCWKMNQDFRLELRSLAVCQNEHGDTELFPARVWLTEAEYESGELQRLVEENAASHGLEASLVINETESVFKEIWTEAMETDAYKIDTWGSTVLK